MPLPPKPHPHLPAWFSVALRAGFWTACMAVAIAAWQLYASGRLPYNGEGRYFDAEQGVVFLQQEREFWALVLVVAAGTATGCLRWLKRPPSTRFLP